MAVVSVQEISQRALTHRFGDPPSAKRKFVVELDSPGTSVTEIANSVGIFHGQPHPEFPFITMVSASVSEGIPTPYHAEIVYDYQNVDPDERDPNPLARPDIWSFSTGGASVPALTYIDGGVQKALVNSAGDLFEGLTTEEGECRASISGNRASFPLATVISVTNTINSDAYLGAPADHWKCVGISGQQQMEVVNDAEIRYWSVSIELAYRQTGWNLQIPDVGFNCIEGGQKIRAFVIDPDTNERVACVSPVALNNDGTIKAAGQVPDILERRVNRRVAFNTFFGVPAWL